MGRGHRLKEKLAQRAAHAAGSRQLTPASSFKELVEVWLASLDLQGGVAPSARALDECNMRQLVMPVFEHFTLREVTIGRIEPFLKSLGTNKSFSYVVQLSRLSGGPGGAPAGAAVTSPR